MERGLSYDYSSRPKQGATQHPQRASRTLNNQVDNCKEIAMSMYPKPKQPTIPIVQVTLRGVYKPEEILTTWVDKRPGLSVGSRITLKDWTDPKVLWEVEKLYPGVHDSKDFDWHRKWDNNI